MNEFTTLLYVTLRVDDKSLTPRQWVELEQRVTKAIERAIVEDSILAGELGIRGVADVDAIWKPDV